MSLVFVALFVVSVVIQLRTWRKQRRVRPALIAVSQISAVAASIGFSVLTKRPPEADAWVGLIAVGLVGGWLYGGMMNVDRNERGVVMSYSFPAIITWATLMTITQLSAILSKSVPIVIYSIAIANLGVNLGMNGRVLSGYSRMRGVPATGAIAVFAVLILSGVPAVQAQVLPPNGGACPEGSHIALVDSTESYEVQAGTPGAVMRCVPDRSPEPTVPTETDTTVPAVDGDPSGGPCADGGHLYVQDEPDGPIYDVCEVLRNNPTGATVPTDSGTSVPIDSPPIVPTAPPVEDETSGPLDPEDAAAATALSAFLLAGGSLAQLLPLLQGGMSLTDALRSVGDGSVPSGSAGALSGLPVLEDGRVMFQPPWEEGGPVPMDRDRVLDVMERQRRGERWMGESRGWMTDARIAENAGWDAADREAVARAEAEFRAKQAEAQAVARAELTRRREALEYLDRAGDAALRHRPEQFRLLLERMSTEGYLPDGSVNVEWVDQFRGVMGRVLRREMQFPEESLHQGWVGDFAANTWDDARHSALIRIGSGVLSGGTSEVYYQGQAVWDGVGKASEQSGRPLTLADGLRAGYWAAADENLPITTLTKVYEGEEVGILDVVGDVLKGANVHSQAKATIREHVADADGLFAWQRREIQEAATRSGVHYQPMQVNAEGKFRLFEGRGEYVGKPSWMKQKSINADDVRYLGYSKNQIGGVPGPPKPPSGFSNAAEYRAANAHYQKRVAEWNANGGTTKAKLASGELAEVDGVLHTVENGKPAKPFVSDIEPAKIVDANTGAHIDDAQAVKFQKELMERGLEAGDHGSPYTFDPRTALKDDLPLDQLQRIEQVPAPGGGTRWQLDGVDLPEGLAAKVQKADDLKTSLIRKVEAGEAGEYIFAGGRAGARPRYDATGAALQDFQERGI